MDCCGRPGEGIEGDRKGPGDEVQRQQSPNHIVSGPLAPIRMTRRLEQDEVGKEMDWSRSLSCTGTA